MHIDGFRFDLASVFSRNADGSLNWGEAPIFSEIAVDPELGRVRLIAEPWDTAAYQLGRQFSGPDLAAVERAVSRRRSPFRQGRSQGWFPR
jgi:pullulanase/glycogen debranching enzyme